MWFDAARAMERATAQEASPAPKASAPPEIAEIAEIAAPLPRKSAPLQAAGNGREADASALAAHLGAHGPCTYGAAASALGWGATRAWQAEALLRAEGRIVFDGQGRAAICAQVSAHPFPSSKA